LGLRIGCGLRGGPVGCVCRVDPGWAERARAAWPGRLGQIAGGAYQLELRDFCSSNYSIKEGGICPVCLLCGIEYPCQKCCRCDQIATVLKVGEDHAGSRARLRQRSCSAKA
jgi:hypothetical protein